MTMPTQQQPGSGPHACDGSQAQEFRKGTHVNESGSCRREKRQRSVCKDFQTIFTIHKRKQACSG